MPTVIKPRPDQASTQTILDCTVLQLGNEYFSAKLFDGDESNFTSINRIVDSLGEPIELVWQKDWVDIAPGIRSKSGSLEIQASACPITILFKRKRVSRTWNRRNDEYDCHTTERQFTIRYEAES